MKNAYRTLYEDSPEFYEMHTCNSSKHGLRKGLIKTLAVGIAAVAPLLASCQRMIHGPLYSETTIQNALKTGELIHIDDGKQKRYLTREESFAIMDLEHENLKNSMTPEEYDRYKANCQMTTIGLFPF